MEKLNALRQKLDGIDAEIVELLNQRIEVANDIALWKEANSQPLTDPERENVVITQAQRAARNPILREYMRSIFQDIMEVSKASRCFNEKTKLPFTKIGIIGLGLMGGSIVKALKAKNELLTIYTLAGESVDVQQAIDSHLIDKTFSSLEDLAGACELLILALPASSTLDYANKIAQLAPCLKNPLVVMDIASVKEKNSFLFETLSHDKIEFVATHPMSGREKSGFANSLATLFIHRPWIITPHQKNSGANIKKVSEVVSYLGAYPVQMDASTHDRQVALISHLPSFLSWWILDFVKNNSPESLAIAGPGFQSMIRLAGHDNLRSEVAQYNQKNIHRYVTEWILYLSDKQAEMQGVS